jgi:putative spermidine/putrescine transport system ATP-binding protein
MSDEAFLRLSGLALGYGAANVVEGLDLSVRRGELVALLGPSGCGKTTTMRAIAGLLDARAGRIELDGRDITRVPANRRDVGLVFQSYALFPHLSAFENVAFGLRLRRIARAELERRVEAALASVGLTGFGARLPRELSGGQQQRVALARAMVVEPRLLLLDEPLSNLDAKLRDHMRIELRQLIKQLGITTIFVTHDQIEALSMSDRIMLMREGAIVQIGTPRDIYLQPGSSFASDFMGRSNLIACRLVDASAGLVRTAFGELQCVVPPGIDPKGPHCVAVRPLAMTVSPSRPGEAPARNSFVGKLREVTFLGDLVEGHIELAGVRLRAAIDPYAEIPAGQTVRVDFGQGRCVVVNDDMGIGAASP